MIKWLIDYQLSISESPIVCSFIFSGHIHFYCQNTHDSNRLTKLTWYHQNPHRLDGHHTYVTLEHDKNNIEMQEVSNTLTTQEARGLQ